MEVPIARDSRTLATEHPVIALGSLRAKFATGGVVLADQALVSFSNFSATVLLVRGLGLEAFGRFALLWMAVVFVQSLQQACVGTPMLTIGPKEEQRIGNGYYAAALRLELVFIILVLTFGMILAPFVARGAGLTPRQDEVAAVLLLAVSRSAHDFMRQSGFARERWRWVLALDVLTYGGQLVLLATLFLATRLTVGTAFLGLALPSLAGTIAGLCTYGPLHGVRGALRSAWVRHAGMSRWLVALAVTQWFTSNAFAVAAGIVLGPIAVGAIKAGQTVMGILHVFLLAVENVVPVRAAALAARGAWDELRGYMTRVALFGGVATLAVSSFVAIFPAPLSRLFYGHENADQSLAIRGFALLYLFSFAISVIAIHLRTLERTGPIFVAQALGALASLIAARPTVEVFGFRGAIAGMVLQQVLILLTLCLVMRSAVKVRTPRTQAA